MTPLHYQSLAEIAQRLRVGELTARALAEHILARAAALAERTNAFITLMPEAALAAADRADAARAEGRLLGPLHGVPVNVKDMFDIAGVPTTAGMPSRIDHRAATNATIIDRLQTAGAVIVGKVNLAEGVFGKYVPPFNEPLNPWSLEHWGGASSGGSGVSMAAGLGYASMASDTGGSIRMPSAVNGVTGLKPSWGRISRHGAFELAGLLDHVGVIARSAEDVAIMLGVVAGADPADPTTLVAPVPDYVAQLSQPVSRLRIGVPRQWLAQGVETGLLDAIESALDLYAGLGARISDFSLAPEPELVDRWYDICTAHVALVHAENFARHRETYSEPLALAIETGRALPVERLQRAYRYRTEFAGRLAHAMADVDLIAVPAIPTAPPTRAAVEAMDNETMFALHRFTSPFSMAGVPTITLPCGVTPDGLPYAIQLVAKPLAEPMLLNAAHAFQKVTEHHRRFALP